ncbi:HAD-IA family hydrolase [Desulfococcaceae bacterium HSG8]|nr:HAD-IA family hydrolase [Desulfococcaceae bacterium HSG8]
MRNIQLVAFDCDGVMFDTTEANKAYYNKILAQFGRPEMDEDQFAYSHMHTADESVAYLFSDKDQFEAAQAYRKTMTYKPFIRYMEIEPFLKPLLKNLRPAYKTAIVTNRTDTMPQVLEEFDLASYFDLVITALDSDRPKPHPDPLIMALEHFKIDPSHAIYVGDSEVDEAAAKAAGVPFVAYDNRSLDAEFHITGLEQIGDILSDNQ